jgi:transposase-like protein
MKRRIRRVDEAKHQYWQNVVRRWQRDGGDVRAYCRKVGVKESAFYWWRRRLEDCKPNAVKRAMASALPARPQFVPLQVVTDPAIGSGSAVEVVLGNGRIVRVRSGVDRRLLAEVLSVAEERSC